jgi:NAD(P)H-dependent FMN reductase
MSSTKSIAIITGSTRTPRVGPDVAKFIQKTIQKADLQDVSLASVDLASFKLPVYDEPSVPAMIPEPDKYANEHSRRWAQEIARHDGYILVSPEYNYGMPGSVKNAIDYLYHPWKGKPIAIVTYGLDGGKTSSAQLDNTLSRMGLKVATIRPQLPFKGGGAGADTGSAMMKGELGSDSLKEWTEVATEDIVKAFEEVKAAVLNPYTQDKKD